MQNQHRQAVPAAVVEEMRATAARLIELMTPYAVSLTPAERQTLPKMGEKTLSFVERAHQQAQNYPGIRPPFLDMAEFDIDFADAHGLWELKTYVRQLDDLVNDTVMTAGSEAYQAALVFYSAAKVAAAQDVHGAKAVYEDLRTRFPRRRRQSGEEAGA